MKHGTIIKRPSYEAWYNNKKGHPMKHGTIIKRPSYEARYNNKKAII